MLALCILFAFSTLAAAAGTPKVNSASGLSAFLMLPWFGSANFFRDARHWLDDICWHSESAAASGYKVLDDALELLPILAGSNLSATEGWLASLLSLFSNSSKVLSRHQPSILYSSDP